MQAAAARPYQSHAASKHRVLMLLHPQAAGEEQMKTGDIGDPAAPPPIVSSGRTFGNRRGSANSG